MLDGCYHHSDSKTKVQAMNEKIEKWTRGCDN